MSGINILWVFEQQQMAQCWLVKTVTCKNELFAGTSEIVLLQTAAFVFKLYIREFCAGLDDV